nr:actin [Tanacetum cinerariifolium]
GAEFPTHLFHKVLDTCSALTRRVENLEHDKAAQKLVIIKLKARVKRLERVNNVKSSKLRRLKKVGTSQRVESSDDIEDVFNQGRMIDDLDKDERIELVVDQVKDADIAKTEGRHAAEQAEKQAEIYHLDLDHPSKILSMQEDDSEVQEVVKVVTTAKLITEVVTAATSQVSAASATISAAKLSIPDAAPTVVDAYTRKRKRVIIRDPKEELSSKTLAETPKLKDKGKGILIETPKPMKKKNQIELDAEYARKLHEEINKDIDWDAAIDQKSKEIQYIKRYQVMKKRPQTESEARKNMMIYLKNTTGYKLDFFKRMSYDDIRPIFQARFDANMRFLFKSREEMEEEYREKLLHLQERCLSGAFKITERFFGPLIATGSVILRNPHIIEIIMVAIEEPSIIGLEADGIHDAIFNSIITVKDVNMIREMFNHIMLSGVSTIISDRLNKELRAKAHTNMRITVDAPRGLERGIVPCFSPNLPKEKNVYQLIPIHSVKVSMAFSCPSEVHHVDTNRQRPFCTHPRGLHSWQSSLVSPEGMVMRKGPVQDRIVPLQRQHTLSTVAITKIHSASSDIQVKMDKKALIEQGIMSLIEAGKLAASWCTLVRFPGSSDPCEGSNAASAESRLREQSTVIQISKDNQRHKLE